MMTNLFIVLTATLIMHFPAILHSQDSVTKEAGVNTCISFVPSNNMGTWYIKRSDDSLCVYVNNVIFSNQPAWNRSFSCNHSISGLSVCFTDTMASDAGVFYLVSDHDNKTEYSTTLIVQYPPKALPLGTHRTIEGNTFSIDCPYSSGNPSFTTFYWEKENSSDRYTSQTLRLPNIRRIQSGNYVCFAENTYSSGNKGSTNSTMILDVQYPPDVSPIDDIKAITNTDVTVDCNVTSGNPSNEAVYWTKSGDSGFKKFGTTLVLNSISRSDSGNYSCVAENSYQSVGKGTDQQAFVLDVLYGPTLTNAQDLTVAEGQTARLSVIVTSNPPSNVSWYRGDTLLSSWRSVNGTTSYTISRTQCTDTGNFWVTADNGIESNQNITVSLFINCSPRLTTGGSTIYFNVDNNRNLQGEISILSYPRPNFSLTLPNGAPNTLIATSISARTYNIFKLIITRSGLHPEDYGSYNLEISNDYGRKAVNVYIRPISKPYPAAQVLVSCGYKEASITWQSSYFGYETQYSIAQFSTDNVVFVNGSYNTTENTKQGIFQTAVYNLNDNTQYFFKVTTINSHGSSTSIVRSCTTRDSQDVPSQSSSLIVGSILGVFLVLAIATAVGISFKYFILVKRTRDRPKPYYDIRKSTDMDNHTYELYSTEDKECGLDTENAVSKSNNESLKSSKETSEETATRYTDFKPSHVKHPVLKSPHKVKSKKERMYENLKDLALEAGKVKPQVLPKPKKS